MATNKERRAVKAHEAGQGDGGENTDAAQSPHAWRGQAVEATATTGEEPEAAATRAEGKAPRDAREGGKTRSASRQTEDRAASGPELDDDDASEEQSAHTEEQKRRAAAEDHAAAPSKHGPHGRL